MSPVLTTAPGKVLLAGEYAVLFGAPAIVAAVECRATVTVRPATASLLRTRGFQEGEWPFTVTGDSPVFESASVQMPLFSAALATCGLQQDAAIELDTVAFADPSTGTKYGLGSSAALTVALVSALCAAASRQELLQTALTAHRHLQGGRGSGADIAAAVFGGVIEYRMNATPTPVAWPDGLQARLYWSGQPASTTRKIDLLQQRLDGNADDKPLSELARAAVDCAGAWRQGGDVLPAMHRYTDTLRRFDDAHGLGIFGAGHQNLHQRAADSGLLYKPCGAGGGDIGVLLAPQDGDCSDFDRLASEQGFCRLDMALGGSAATLRDS